MKDLLGEKIQIASIIFRGTAKAAFGFSCALPVTAEDLALQIRRRRHMGLVL